MIFHFIWKLVYGKIKTIFNFHMLPTLTPAVSVEITFRFRVRVPSFPFVCFKIPKPSQVWTIYWDFSRRRLALINLLWNIHIKRAAISVRGITASYIKEIKGRHCILATTASVAEHALNFTQVLLNSQLTNTIKSFANNCLFLHVFSYVRDTLSRFKCLKRSKKLNSFNNFQITTDDFFFLQCRTSPNNWVKCTNSTLKNCSCLWQISVKETANSEKKGEQKL